MDILIPKTIKDEIENLNITKAGRRHAYRFYFLYITKLVCENDIKNKKNGYVKITSIEMRKHFTSNYFKLFVEEMLNQNFITRTPFYTKRCAYKYKGTIIPKQDKPHFYRIEPDYLDFTQLEFVQLNKPIEVDKSENITYHTSNMEQLVFDFCGMKKIIENINVEDYISIPNRSNLKAVRVTFPNGSKYFINVQDIDELLSGNRQFFQYKNEYFIADIEEFIHNKTVELKTSYCYSLSKLYNNQFYARRNNRNNRLDSNLTNLSKVFFEEDLIRWDDENLREVDLRNSQPCILNYLLHHKEFAISLIDNSNIKFPFFMPDDDLDKFTEYTESGKLYELIARELEISREVAKLSIFEILFSSEKYNSTNKKILKTLFPSVVRWIDAFKELNKKNTFPVMLQQLESYLFIDYLLPRLQANHIKVLTKHDCFLCRERDEQAVRDVIEEGFYNIGFKFRLSA
ncbi:MAG: hypothetical protein ACEPOW_14400 [Bacteroidales bacterium]